MSSRRSFYRKILYVGAVALLLLPLSWLSSPAVRGTASQPGSAGGKLAQLRSRYRLSQADLGEIDPASETIRLATLGLRGVAANILWSKANYYKMTEDWTNLSATLRQITKLQPNFISVWQFQAWNLSYNVSAEFDDYRDRYHWVIRGIEFLKQGERYNVDNPRLLWDIGWFISQKIGRADEYKQFRKLFKADDDFHPPDRPRGQRDNWLVGKQWYRRAERSVLSKDKPLRIRGKGKSDLIFFSDAPMCQINYSSAIEEEGILGEVARLAWKRGGREWYGYGNMPLSYISGHKIHLNDLDRLKKEVRDLQTQLDALAPGTRERIVKERRAALSEAERKACDTPSLQRTAKQYRLASRVQSALHVSPMDMARRIARERPDKEDEAVRLGRALAVAQRRRSDVQRHRAIINYDYWQARCRFEQTPEALSARAKIYQGDRALADANLVEAKRLYDQGLAEWRAVLDRFPLILNDTITGEDLMDIIKKYRKILDELDEPFPSDFVLIDVVRQFDTAGDFSSVLEASRSHGPSKRDAKTGQKPASDR